MNKPSDSELLEEVHICLVGKKLTGQKGLIDTVYEIRQEQSITRNQINTLMQDREKRIEKEREKAASKLAFRKFLNVLTLGLIKKLTTGI